MNAPGGPAFPNARYVIGRAEHAFWGDEVRVAELPPDPAQRGGQLVWFRSTTQALEPRLALVDDAAEAEIVPGLRAVAAPGHTPGRMGVLVESDGERLPAVFDAFSHPLHVASPEWNSVFDAVPDQTDASRCGLVERMAADRLLVASYHFPYPGSGRVGRQGDAFLWEPAT